MAFRVDSEFRYQLADGLEAPLLFEPDTQWDQFRGRTIVHDY